MLGLQKVPVQSPAFSVTDDQVEGDVKVYSLTMSGEPLPVEDDRQYEQYGASGG